MKEDTKSIAQKLNDYDELIDRGLPYNDETKDIWEMLLSLSERIDHIEENMQVVDGLIKRLNL